MAWGVLLAFTLVVILGMRELRENDRVQLRAWKSPLSQRATITVLEFDRVVSDWNEGHIHREGFRRQLKALEEDGFEAVSLTDVFEFYYKEKPLPEKSVLLIFANGYLETYAAVDPILREMKWPAAMTVTTEKVVKRETFFLYWDRLRRMVDSGVWDLSLGGQEDPARTDHQASLGIFGESLPGYRLLAQSPATGDAPHYIEKLSDQGSKGPALRKLFPLRFINSFVGVNDIGSDPLRLRRLRVKPEWPSETLLTLLNKGIQASLASLKKTTPVTSMWFQEDGEMMDSSFILKHHPDQNTGLDSVPHTGQEGGLPGAPAGPVFFPGGSRAGNWILEADVRLDNGQFWVRQNSSATNEVWRVGGNSEKFNAQVRVAHGAYKNLVNSREGISPGEWHHLKLMKRAHGIVVYWDDRLLWDLPVSTPSSMNGDIGLWVWSDDGKGSVSLSDVRLSFFPDDIRWLENYLKEEGVQSLIRQTHQVSGVTVVTHAVQGGHSRPIAFDEALFKIISHRYAWEFIPTVQILPHKLSSKNIGPESEEKIIYEEAMALSMATIKKLVKQNQWTRLHLDLSRLDLEIKNEWFPNVEKIRKALEQINCRLLVSLEGRPDSSKAIKLESHLLENSSKSTGWVAQKSRQSFLPGKS